jgi:hypothetical protein
MTPRPIYPCGGCFAYSVVCFAPGHSVHTNSITKENDCRQVIFGSVGPQITQINADYEEGAGWKAFLSAG